MGKKSKLLRMIIARLSKGIPGHNDEFFTKELRYLEDNKALRPNVFLTEALFAEIQRRAQPKPAQKSLTLVAALHDRNVSGEVTTV